MLDKLLMLSVKLKTLLGERGQDLIEYSLVVALISFGAVAGMSTVADDVNSVFGKIDSVLISQVG